ncbi:DUF6056 family protein [Prevotella sp. 10(H)]|uniref:DUF3329 domain-containing protein n=1 Tax=Prevotella sp. 10(H) TaxID=1158294 RepID=UPI00056037EB|nr:DUF6056 family protein [Prevotella sp. 10(H)]
MIINDIFHKVTDNKVQKAILIASSFVLFIIIFILNRLYPLYADDWTYIFIFGENPSTRVHNLFDIFTSQYNHYVLWGGRSVVHFIAQLLLLLPVSMADMINSLAFLGYILVIYKLVNQGNNANAFVFIITAILAWLCLPLFAGTVLWITGSANYLWGTLIMLLFLYPYYIDNKEKAVPKNSIWKASAFLLLGIIAGWTNENMSVAAIFMIFVFCIFQRKYGNIKPWMLTGLIGLCIGCAIMLIAPGNYHRAEVINEYLNTSNEPFLKVIMFRLSFFPAVYMKHLLILLVVYIISLIVFYKTSGDHLNKREIIFKSLLFVITAHIAFFALIATPVFPERALFCVVTFMIIGIMILYANMRLDTLYLQAGNLLIIVLLCGGGFIDFYRKYPSIHLMSKTFRAREIFLQEQKEKGIEDIIFTGRIGLHSKFGFTDLEENPDGELNRIYSKYYNVRSVRVIPDKE